MGKLWGGVASTKTQVRIEKFLGFVYRQVIVAMQTEALTGALKSVHIVNVFVKRFPLNAKQKLPSGCGHAQPGVR